MQACTRALRTPASASCSARNSIVDRAHTDDKQSLDERRQPMHRSVRAVVVVSLFTVMGCETDETEPERLDQPDELFAALERDLGQPRPVLERRLAAEAIAAQVAPALRDQLGASFGGAWMTIDGSALVVGI